jgi:hypothetical protein
MKVFLCTESGIHGFDAILIGLNPIFLNEVNLSLTSYFSNKKGRWREENVNVVKKG